MTNLLISIAILVVGAALLLVLLGWLACVILRDYEDWMEDVFDDTQAD
jgi:hypothetical protein